MNGWLRANGWQVVVTVVGLLLLVGEWRQEATATVEDVRRLDARLAAVEAWSQGERPRLDPVYVAREVALAQQSAILQRLDAIESELREVRKALR